MDLGAVLCTPRSPACDRCPLETLCRGRELGLEGELPRKRKRKAVPTVVQVALLLHRRGRVLVRRRPLEGMLGGLWEFPAAAVAEGRAPEEAAAGLLKELGLLAELSAAGGVDHAYSHFRLDLRLFRGELPDLPLVAEGEESRWIDPQELSEWPLHGAHKKALNLL